jgi:hypothetical protein
MSNYLTVSKFYNTGYIGDSDKYRKMQGLQSQKFASMNPACVLYPLCNAVAEVPSSPYVNSFCTQNIQSPESPYFKRYGPCPVLY